MTLDKLFVRLEMGVSIPQAVTGGGVTGSHAITSRFLENFPEAANAWAARVIFGAAGQTLELRLDAGTLTPSAAGVLQEERAFVDGSSGVSQDGIVPLVVTGAGISGSPLTVPVTLKVSRHNTSLKIAAALAAELNATAQLAAFTFAAGGTENLTYVSMKRKYPSANDGTLNLTIPDVLGIDGYSSSTNAAAGAAGVVIQRVGGDGYDVNGTPLAVANNLHAAFLSAAEDNDGNITSVKDVTAFVALPPGAVVVLTGTTSYNLHLSDLITFTAPNKSVMDLIFVTS